MRTQRVLVVGTTSDYIDIIRHKYPSKSLLFITSPAIRDKATEEKPEPDEELLCELDVAYDHLETVIILIRQHLESYNISLKGIVCFDCESMPLAANIAAAFCLPYPSIEAVMACRDKSITRKLWHANQVPCPQYARVSSAAQAVDFFENLSDETSICVLKPVDSSGSERVFKCSTAKECETAYNIICKPQESPDIIIETYVEGTEYSCDFIIDDTACLRHTDNITQKVYESQVIPIRLTRKIPAPIPIFGTIMAYEIVDFLSENENCSQNVFPASCFSSSSENFSINDLLPILAKAAKSLGITRSICMVDFIVKDTLLKEGVIQNGNTKSNNPQNHGESYDSIALLEMAPRPGGDCLPWLIQRSMNIDILKLTLDFACKQKSIFN
ncbi:MAG: ATP-grasp domain-containing protein, partial [Desulfamplus sp.]|nr:ATP-grasp domain-containing protein [Desulfamplus sp.]